MQNNISNVTMKKKISAIITFLFVMVMAAIIQAPNHVYAQDETVYKDGIYCYNITNGENKEVTLVGVELSKALEELDIPGTAVIDDSVYTVSNVDFNWNYYRNEKYESLYKEVFKINIADNFQGTIKNLLYAFPNLDVVQFYGKTTPQKVHITTFNTRKNPDVLFVVPGGTEDAYAKVISETMDSSLLSDPDEYAIKMIPTIVSDITGNIEYNCFQKDGFIYQVIASAKGGQGKVQLVGLSSRLKDAYLSLTEIVNNNGYTYKLTKICEYALFNSGAKAVVIPDSVTSMESAIFDFRVELLFLSKNCKVIPSRLIINENYDSNLRFTYVPEGVTTISDNAFNNHIENESSIILPTTIKSVGTESLYGFKLITFLNKKPISNISQAIKNGTTVKVKSSSVSAYKSSLNSKISVTSAKDIIKATELTLNKSSLKLNTINTYQLKGTLTKGSNETIYWLSSDTNIFDISDKGVVNPKSAGTAYVIAYTRTSGLHQAIKVTVSETSITKGIYTYRVNNALNRTVTIYSIKPKATDEKLIIPETITYENKTYTVTEVIADSKNMDIPLINDKNNKIKEIVFPKSIRGMIGYLGQMKKIKSITFEGKTAPERIVRWYLDGGLLAFQAVIYVPKNCVNVYSSALELNGSDDMYSMIHYGCELDFNVSEIASGQLQRFVKDGILYRVNKNAGTKNGNVAVKGADVNLEKIDVGGMVSFGKYKYDVTEVYARAFRESNAHTINLGDSIKKVGNKQFNEKVKNVKWSANAKTIYLNTFDWSREIYNLGIVEHYETVTRKDFYALETFIIPNGVTTIQAGVFKNGFANVTSITVPASLTNIGNNAFKSIGKVIYK